MRTDRANDTVLWLVGLSVCAAMVVVVIWFFSTHPCAKWEEHQCTETRCTVHDGKGNCLSWTSHSYICSECREWVKDAPIQRPAEAQ